MLYPKATALMKLFILASEALGTNWDPSNRNAISVLPLTSKETKKKLKMKMNPFSYHEGER